MFRFLPLLPTFVPRPLSSHQSTSPLPSCLLLLIVIAPIFVRLLLSLPALKGITAIVATERAITPPRPPSVASDTVTVLTSFARGVDPNVKSVTGGSGASLSERGRGNDVVVAPSHM